MTIPAAKQPQASPAADRRLPYLFAYDIGDDRRARAARQCLQRWRLDGQLSVHETRLLPFQVRELATELLDYVDSKTDRLLACRLSQRGGPPVHPLSLSARRPPLAGPHGHSQADFQPRRGWYLLAYDVRDPQRLQRVQRRAARTCLFLQRSVYLYHGSGQRLVATLAEVKEEIHRQVDDARLYSLAGPGDLWFLSGPLPPLAELGGQGPGLSLWGRLRVWLGSHR